MKTMKLLLTGLLLLGVTSFTGVVYATSAVGTLTGTENYTSFLAKFQQYMDSTELSGFIAAYQANQKADSPKTFSDFFMDYAANTPSFYAALVKAIEKAKDASGTTEEDKIIAELKQQVEDLKDEIAKTTNLSDDQKKDYQKLLDNYNSQINQINSQLANSNAALNRALGKMSEPQQKDNTMMIMMIIMMIMMMMKGK